MVPNVFTTLITCRVAASLSVRVGYRMREDAQVHTHTHKPNCDGAGTGVCRLFDLVDNEF